MKRAILFFCYMILAACNGGNAASPDNSQLPSGGSRISDIQGSGYNSPDDGKTVLTVGIVSGDFQDHDRDDDNNLGGFYIQEEVADLDDNRSDGIFVHDANITRATDVSVGDRVQVSGRVQEFFGETQIDATDVSVIGRGSVVPVDVTLPSRDVTHNEDGDYVADLERFEGMLVRFPTTLTVTDVRSLERFGEVSLSQGGRLFQFTNSNAPSKSGYTKHKKAAAARSIILDDGKRNSNPDYLRYLMTDGVSLRLGDSVNELSGNLRYSRGSGGSGKQSWRLMRSGSVEFANNNPRPDAPSVAGAVRVASFNVLNFFAGIDKGRTECGFERRHNCRGADSKRELDRQQEKITSALALMDADIIGLIELENDTGRSTELLVDALNKRIDGDYQMIDTGTINNDAIKTGFIYDASKFRPVGSFALLDSSHDPRFEESLNRPALLQTFELIDGGAKLSIVVNHFKSKGSSCAESGDHNRNDGQGNCNKARRDAAAALADWLATDPTDSDDPDYLILGDLNAYLYEDPIKTLTKAGFGNLLGGDAEPYSFVFDGQSGALDYAIASRSLLPQVQETLEWHINADEPPLFDYNLEHGRDPAYFDASNPYRASDHDPIIIGLDLTQ